MSLTRKYLKEIGIESEKIDLIIEAHSDTVDGLKAERDDLKEKAGKVADLEKEIETLKSKTATDSEWQEKYEKEHSDFEAYKTAETEKALLAEKQAKYEAVLKEAGVSEKLLGLIMKGVDLSTIELKDGEIKDVDKVKEQVKSEYKDYIVTTESSGASTVTPPEGGTPEVDLDKLSMEDFIKARNK